MARGDGIEFRIREISDQKQELSESTSGYVLGATLTTTLSVAVSTLYITVDNSVFPMAMVPMMLSLTTGVSLVHYGSQRFVVTEEPEPQTNKSFFDIQNSILKTKTKALSKAIALNKRIRTLWRIHMTMTIAAIFLPVPLVIA